MKLSNSFIISTCLLVIFSHQIIAQFGGMNYFPYGYNGLSGGGMFPGGGGAGYPAYGGSYYPQYPVYGSYLCYQGIYCGGVYPGYGGYPYYRNTFNTAFASSSSTSSFSTFYATIGGGFFG